MGSIIRFDDIRGYGFISPDIGGEDVFLHVNDLEIAKESAKPGAKVYFDIEEGDRGKFATNVQLADQSLINNTDSAANAPASISIEDEYYDVLSVEEFRLTVTEILLALTPPLAGDQILQARRSLEQVARKQGWVEP